MTKIEQPFMEKLMENKREIFSLLPEELAETRRRGFESLLNSDIHDKNLLNMVAARLNVYGYKELIPAITGKIEELFGGRFQYLPVNEKYLEDQEECS